MKLAVFDLDQTLIAGDSDYLWGKYLAEQGYVDGAEHQRQQTRFYDDYRAGCLDILAFLAFQLQPLAARDAETLKHWHADFMRHYIRPILLPKAMELVQSHREQGHQLLVITSTNRFITEPIVAMFDIPHLIATELEAKDGRFTGGVSGVPSYSEGKVTRLLEWLDGRGGEEMVDESWFYSDSHTDMPLMEWVDHPVAVDPDAKLRRAAEARGWEVRSLRG